MLRANGDAYAERNDESEASGGIFRSTLSALFAPLIRKRKLAKQRAKGFSGWEECSNRELAERLVRHVIKGDPVDIANFAMFLLENRGAPRDVKAELREAFMRVVDDNCQMVLIP